MIEIAWLDRDLRSLDQASGEILVGSLFSDERPPRGVLGLWDWRAGGLLSSLCLSGFAVGARGERFLAPARPRLAFDKLLVIGLGPSDAFDDAACAAATSALLDALDGLRVRRAVVELPGRQAGRIASSRALELLTAALGDEPRTLETIVVVDDRETQRAIEALRVTRARRSLAAQR